MFVFCISDVKLQIGFPTQQKSMSLLEEGTVSDKMLKILNLELGYFLRQPLPIACRIFLTKTMF